MLNYIDEYLTDEDIQEANRLAELDEIIINLETGEHYNE